MKITDLISKCWECPHSEEATWRKLYCKRYHTFCKNVSQCFNQQHQLLENYNCSSGVVNIVRSGKRYCVIQDDFCKDISVCPREVVVPSSDILICEFCGREFPREFSCYRRFSYKRKKWFGACPSCKRNRRENEII